MMPQHNSKLILKLFCTILIVSNVKCEFYSSVHKMTKLLEYEHRSLRNIQQFIAENESKLDFLKAQLVDFERERDEALETGSVYFENPVNQYLLNKRLTVDWARIENIMATNIGEKHLNRMDAYKNQSEFSDDLELNGAIEGFLRLQNIYRLKTEDMAAGILQGITYSTVLEARHCFDIGKFALKANQLKLSHSWLVEALHRLPVESNHLDEPLKRAEILFVLVDTKHKLGDLKGANETYIEILHLEPESEVFAKTYTEFIKETEAKDIATSIDLSEEHEPLPVDFLALNQSERYKLTCSGHITPTPSEERYLRCGYLTETHPFLLIAPLKVEEMNHDPLLVVFYDVISDNEIAVAQKLAQRKIQRSSVLGLNGSEISSVRTSHFAFLPNTKSKVLQAIDRRVEDMTNLNMDYAELHQFSNYGIGGHYQEHYDWFLPEHDEYLGSHVGMGNRIATVLFYLTDVEQGGGTAFPFLKRLLLPKKGAAAFWYNLHASGEPDERTLHGACPIIVGSKWVQNRWIHEHDQSDRRPCELFNDKVHGPF